MSSANSIDSAQGITRQTIEHKTPEVLAAHNKTASISLPIPSLLQNISWTLLGNILYAASQWILLIAIARLGSSQMVGEFALALAIITPVFMFANLNLRLVQVTDANNHYQQETYIFLRVTLSLIAFALISVATLAIYGYTNLAFIIISMAVFRYTESISDIYHGVFHKREEVKGITLSRTLRGLLSVISVSLALWLTQSLLVATIALSAVNIVILCLIDIRTAAKVLPMSQREYIRQHLNFQSVRKLIWLSLPAGLAAYTSSMTVNIPRYLIAQNLDAVSLAYYAAAAYPIVLTDLVVRGTRQAALPRLAQVYQKKQMKQFYKILFLLMGIGFGVTFPALLIAYFWGGEVLALLYTEDYRKAANVFVVLMLANLIWHSAIPSSGLSSAHMYWPDLITRLAGLITTFVSCLFFLPAWGLIGAAWALVAGKAATGLLTTLFTLFLHKKPQITH